ncbi:hypothetical protein F5148DRAFT_1291468 [Russula earlei]|uniref:Uncharacterized protein n=1 Tax=Russula earlei TaxID=71964 RepID=A0ACC0TVX5_9AGAM|nr:hypothetical protein F5148DRAFT_1291468 [Russula earlei]
MSKLETLFLRFQSPPYPANRPRPPLTRFVLPALTQLLFEGVHGCLEDLLAQIEAPCLKKLRIEFFMDIAFVVPQLYQLIGHAKLFKTCHRAAVCTTDQSIGLVIFSRSLWSSEISLAIGEAAFIAGPGLQLIHTPPPSGKTSRTSESNANVIMQHILEPMVVQEAELTGDETLPTVFSLMSPLAEATVVDHDDGSDHASEPLLSAGDIIVWVSHQGDLLITVDPERCQLSVWRYAYMKLGDVPFSHVHSWFHKKRTSMAAGTPL